MKRIDAISIIADEAGDALIVCNLGYPSRELFAMNDRPENFYMLGSMGMASSIGLGLAISNKKRKVWALDGDGSVLMNLGSLSTIACHAPDNYLLIVLDNGVYGSTGSQPTPICARTNVAKLSRAAGIGDVREVDDEKGLRSELRKMNGGVLVVKVEPGNADVAIIDLSPEQIKRRFMDRAARPSG